MNKVFKGCITALVTPFTLDGVVDVPALQKLVDFQIENKIDGLVPCGSTGEAVTLSEDEYRLVIKTVVSEARGRVPVTAGAGSNDTKKAIRFSQIASECGVDGLLHVTPYYNKPMPSGLLAHFKAIAGSVDLPIILYNVPGRTGSNMSAGTTLRLAKEIPQIVGIKEASGNILQMMEIIHGAPEGFILLSGDDALALPVIAVGGMGVISVVSNEIPLQMSQLVHGALEGKFEKARALHYEWLDLMDVNFIETNPVPVKTVLALMGRMSLVARLPLVEMEEANLKKLQVIVQRHELV